MNGAVDMNIWNGEWSQTLILISTSLRQEFRTACPIDDDGAASPKLLALRDAFFAFPFPIDVLLIETDPPSTNPHYSDSFMGTDARTSKVWTLIAHHLGNGSGNQINYHGARRLSDLESYLPLLADRFGLDDPSDKESLQTLRLSGSSTIDSSLIVHFIPCDIRTNPDAYGRYLAHDLFMSHQQALVEQFNREIDFNALYKLKSDPVIPLNEWVKMDPIASAYAGSVSFEERQAFISDIQLIPKIPQDVQLTFQRAREAYTLGYFRYGLFTVAIHYASLTIEAAIKARWSIRLPTMVAVSHGSEITQLQFPSHTKIHNLCFKNRWMMRDVRVDDEPFPFSTRLLLDWLERERIVTRWERGSLRFMLTMRNHHSHLEHPSTDSPSADMLRRTANLVNKLFHGLPQPIDREST
jgi:hypothetical protein